MYKSDYVPISAAQKFVIDNDRSMYEAFLKKIEELTNELPILLAGNSATLALSGDDIGRDDYMWEIYVDDAYNTCIKIAHHLATVHSPHIDIKTISLRTIIKHQEFVINVFARPIIRAYSLGKYRNVDMFKLLKYSCKGVFTKYENNMAHCVAPIMLLIDVYRKLYSPSATSYWERAMVAEKVLTDNIFNVNLQINSSQISGGDDDFKVNVEHIKTLLKNISANTVIVGGFAHGKSARLQLLTDDNIDNITNIMSKICGCQTKFVPFAVGVVSDFRLTKHTIYQINNGKQIAIADIFNSTSYELIPFTVVNGLKIARGWVILRFICIDIHLLNIIAALNGTTANVSNLVNIAQNVRNDITNLMNNGKEFEVFSVDNYCGIHIPDNVAKKKITHGKHYPIYYPAMREEKFKLASSQITGGISENISKLQSQPVDLLHRVAEKKKIMEKFQLIDDDLIKSIQKYAETNANYVKWSQHKKINYRRYSNFLPFIPQKINQYVDVGCGSGLDIMAFKKKYAINMAICADVEDSRVNKNSKFVKVELNKPLNIRPKSTNLLTMFHCIHHMADDLAARIVDIARIMAPGGLVLVRDHDVRNCDEASDVDFEHYVYLTAELAKDNDIVDIARNFDEKLPIFYHSCDEICELFTKNGFETLFTHVTPSYTRVYDAVFRFSDNS